MGTENLHEDTLRRIKRGLTGYISYLAACEMNSSFPEYVLYEPMLRILTARGYEVTCEHAMPNGLPGDDPRIDFVGNHNQNGSIAIEVKWKKENAPQIQNDFQKLNNYHDQNDGSSCFLLFFGGAATLKTGNQMQTNLSNLGILYMQILDRLVTVARSINLPKTNSEKNRG